MARHQLHRTDTGSFSEVETAPRADCRGEFPLGLLLVVSCAYGTGGRKASKLFEFGIGIKICNASRICITSAGETKRILPYASNQHDDIEMESSRHRKSLPWVEQHKGFMHRADMQALSFGSRGPVARPPEKWGPSSAGPRQAHRGPGTFQVLLCVTVDESFPISTTMKRRHPRVARP